MTQDYHNKIKGEYYDYSIIQQKEIVIFKSPDGAYIIV